jgi:Mce-associated membrane protein
MAVDADATAPELSDAGDDIECVEETPTAAGSAIPSQTVESRKALTSKGFRDPVKPALIAGLTMMVALAGLVGWLAYRADQTHQADNQRREFVQAGRQAALDLTTIDHSHVDADVRRILDFTTGDFHDDFQKRAAAFVDAIKKNQSTSVGTIAEAGLESIQGNEGQVLLAVNVKTSTVADPNQPAKAWRMRVGVRKVGDQIKVSDVKFVP